MSSFTPINNLAVENLYEVSSSSSSSASSTILPKFEITGFGFPAELFTTGLIVFASIFIAMITTTIVLQMLRNQNLRKRLLKDWEKRVFLEISVPRETIDDVNKETQRKDEKDSIGIGEQLFAVISEYAKKGLKGYLYGTERFSLEILSIQQKIKFLIVCTEKTADVVEKQILSIYHKADIVRFKNYQFFQPGAITLTQELTLASNYSLPFRTYRLMEKDPLNSISNALSGLNPDESAALQIVITPTNNKTWQGKSRKFAAKIQQGQSPESVMKANPAVGTTVFNNVGYIGREIVSIFKPKNKDEDKPEPKDRKIDLTGKTQAIQLTPQQQEIIKQLESKASRPGFVTTIRVIAAAASKTRAQMILDSIIPAFQIFDIRPFNGIVRSKRKQPKDELLNFILRAPNPSANIILNTEELISLWHLPSYQVQNPYINWLASKRPSIPLGIPAKDITTMFMGMAKSGSQSKEVNVKMEDRFRHNYILGGTGSGKSVLMTQMILQDIQMGNGVCVVDPHGETIDDLLLRMPKERQDDVIIFSPSFTDFPLGLNLLEYDRLQPSQRTTMIDTLFSIWDKLYDLKATGGPMFESYMTNAMRLVMSHEASGSTLMEIPKVLTNEDYRAFKLAMCDDQQVRDFWEKEAQKAGGDAALENMVPYITSKLNKFVTNDFIRPMIGQQKSAINFRLAMDTKKIVLLKLEKGLIGEQSAYLLGMVVIGNLLNAGMGRNDGKRYNEDGTTTPILASERPPFFIYIDEMQNFLFDAIPKALEEVRKYKVGLTLAHQFVKQVINKGDERIKDSILANCASKYIFRCNAEDAELLSKEFSPILSVPDLINPEKFTCNAILLLDGQKSTPFNIAPPALSPNIDVAYRDELINITKQRYGKSIASIEADIRDRVEKFMF
jgi:Helicase HerA, central domain/TraM recognition site of TraD and TraG